jgi:malic enzyme
LSVRAKRITEKMKKAAAYALAGMINEEDISEEKYNTKCIYARCGMKKVAEAVAQGMGGIKG